MQGAIEHSRSTQEQARAVVDDKGASISIAQVASIYADGSVNLRRQGNQQADGSWTPDNVPTRVMNPAQQLRVNDYVMLIHYGGVACVLGKWNTATDETIDSLTVSRNNHSSAIVNLASETATLRNRATAIENTNDGQKTRLDGIDDGQKAQNNSINNLSESVTSINKTLTSHANTLGNHSTALNNHGTVLNNHAKSIQTLFNTKLSNASGSVKTGHIASGQIVLGHISATLDNRYSKVGHLHAVSGAAMLTYLLPSMEGIMQYALFAFCMVLLCVIIFLLSRRTQSKAETNHNEE